MSNTLLIHSFQSRLKVWATAVMFFFGVILFEFLGLFSPLRATVQEYSMPLLEGVSRVFVMVGSPLSYLRNFYDTKARIADLELRYSEASVHLAELDSLRKENQELKKFLGEEGVQPGGTGYIGRPIVSFGVPTVALKEGESVISGSGVLVQGVLVGRVSRHSSSLAEVKLLSNSGSSPLLVQTDRGETGLVIGTGVEVLLTQLTSTADVRTGDKILTIAQEQIPAGILVGRVGESRVLPQSAVKTVVVEQYVSFLESFVAYIWSSK